VPSKSAGYAIRARVVGATDTFAVMYMAATPAPSQRVWSATAFRVLAQDDWRPPRPPKRIVTRAYQHRRPPPANAIASKPNAPWKSAGSAIPRPVPGATASIAIANAAAPIMVALTMPACRASSANAGDPRECRFSYLRSAYLIPVSIATPASAVITAAKVICAMSEVVVTERNPIPITGSELPANTATM
jgi:hypothetical protein